jgi:FtsH-binding integral membrane protein
MYDQNNMQSGSAYEAGATSTVDAGLRQHMLRVYNAVGAGLALSGVAAFAVFSIPALQAIFMNPLVSMVIGIGLLVFLWFGMNPNKAMQQPLASLKTKYYIFCAALGTTLAYVFAVYSGASVARVFFITASMFGGISLLGYTTKKDLSGFGSFLLMGLIGIIVAMLVNIFLKSTGLSFVISIVSVLVFTGLIAWETQAAKRLYNPANADETNAKLAILSALGLYINFINLFQTLLRLFGNRN